MSVCKNRVFVLQPDEDWVCDRFVSEWYEKNADMSVKSAYDADVIWLLAGWCWNRVPLQLLREKKVVCTVHHIDPDKFDARAQQEFIARDQFVDLYHVPSMQSARVLTPYTHKPMFIQPFWVNQRIWHPLDRGECRLKHNIDTNAYVVGSFQRDTEGCDLVTPKLAKGPDVFCDVVEYISKHTRNVHVVLAGWRRQYVMSRLDAAHIPYTYFDRPSFSTINELYNTLDMYVVGSRYEGGPQALFECAATQTPIISTQCGYAEQLLGMYDEMKKTPIFKIYDALLDEKLVGLKSALSSCDTTANFDNVIELFIPNGMQPFRRMFDRV